MLRDAHSLIKMSNLESISHRLERGELEQLAIELQKKRLPVLAGQIRSISSFTDFTAHSHTKRQRHLFAEGMPDSLRKLFDSSKRHLGLL